MPWTEPSASLIASRDLVGPQAERLQLVDQVAVDLQEVARQRLALEQVRDLRLDALVAAGDRGDGRGRRDRDQQRVAQAVLARCARAARPSAPVSSGVDAPRVELQLAARRARLGERRVRALLARPARTRPTARGSRSPRRCARDSARASGESNGRRSWKNTSCRPITPSPTGRQRRFDARAGVDRVVVEVDHAIELAHRRAHGARELVEVERAPSVVARVRAEVDRAEVAHRGLVLPT